jgi:hypothetical protein
VKPHVVKAWACSSCHKPYPHTPFGKVAALGCCGCRECGGRGEYTGMETICDACHAKIELKNAEENLVAAQERFKRAQDAQCRIRSH